MGHPTLESGGKKTFIRYLKNEQTHRETHRQMDISTYRKHWPRGPMLRKYVLMVDLALHWIFYYYQWLMMFSISFKLYSFHSKTEHCSPILHPSCPLGLLSSFTPVLLSSYHNVLLPSYTPILLSPCPPACLSSYPSVLLSVHKYNPYVWNIQLLRRNIKKKYIFWK